jgi:hypothetical protein
MRQRVAADQAGELLDRCAVTGGACGLVARLSSLGGMTKLGVSACPERDGGLKALARLDRSRPLGDRVAE